MGRYINPDNCTKEQFLRAYGIPIRLYEIQHDFSKIMKDYSIVCLVSTRVCSVAAICHDMQEFEVYSDPEDVRPKAWYIVPKEHMTEYL